MSLSGALSNAMSGLNANARGTTVISANIANALNEEYGRRELALATDVNQTSGGVRVLQVTRYSDPTLEHQKRFAIADFSASSAFAEFDIRFEGVVGSVDVAGGIAEKLTRLETAFLSASSDPASETRLRSISFAAEEFALAMRKASREIEALRSHSETQILHAVEEINTGLAQIEGLNTRIMTARHLGQDALSLVDRRDSILEKLSEFVPLHVIERESGVIALFTAQGRTLLDEKAVKLDFAKQPLVLPHMTVTNGFLSRLKIDGQEVDVPGSGLIERGALAAHFVLRDETAPQVQTKLDAIARDVIQRFDSGGPDTTLFPGEPGAFTDSGLSFLPGNEIGLAGRLALNPVLSSSGSNFWRWRDGINAAAQGDLGRSDLLLNLQSQISTPLTPNSLSLGASPRSLADHLQNLSTDAAVNRVRTSAMQQTASNSLDMVRESEAQNGVNTDLELQKLVELEKSYAANARVIRVIDQMLSELLAI